MGVYVYTLRKKTFTAIKEDGSELTFGYTAFGWKCSYRGTEAGIEGRLTEMAWKARKANPELIYLVEGDPVKHFKKYWGPMPVYKVKNNYIRHWDVEPCGDYVGAIFKVGRKYVFRDIPYEEYSLHADAAYWDSRPVEYESWQGVGDNQLKLWKVTETYYLVQVGDDKLNRYAFDSAMEMCEWVSRFWRQLRLQKERDKAEAA